MRVAARGYGAGGRDTPGEPNLLRLLVGEERQRCDGRCSEPIAVIETVIDDSDAAVAGLRERVAAGGRRVGCVPRGGADEEGPHGRADDGAFKPGTLPALRDLLLRETTTIGLRWRLENKMALEREFAEVETEWGKVRIKVARWPSGEVANASPEYEECRKLAHAARGSAETGDAGGDARLGRSGIGCEEGRR